MNNGQVVSAGDARAIATALERGLPDIPRHDAAKHKTERVRVGNEWLDVYSADADVSPWEAFSGKEGREYVEEFIAFCRKGAFQIW